MPRTRRTVEYAVQFCVGSPTDQEAVEVVSSESGRGVMQDIRRNIADGTYDRDDYEPMRLVKRTVVTTTGDWERA